MSGSKQRTFFHLAAMKKAPELSRYRSCLGSAQAAAGRQGVWQARAAGVAEATSRPKRSPATPYAGGWRSRTHGPHEICGLNPLPGRSAISDAAFSPDPALERLPFYARLYSRRVQPALERAQGQGHSGDLSSCWAKASTGSQSAWRPGAGVS